MISRIWKKSSLFAAMATCLVLTHSAMPNDRGGPVARQIQIYRVNFDSQVVTLKNMSASPISLNGFRFCTNSPGQLLRYTSASGLNGITLAAGAELYIHWNNDAPMSASHRNLSSLSGLAATPLIRNAYALSLYWPVSVPIDFNNPAAMADYLQWSSTGLDPGSGVNARADEAVTAGLWTAAAQWIDTQPNTRTITLTDLSGGILHGPANYAVVAACFGDITPIAGDGTVGDGQVTIADVNLAVSSFGLGPGPADILPHPGGDGQVTIADINAVLSNFGVCASPP